MRVWKVHGTWSIGPRTKQALAELKLLEQLSHLCSNGFKAAFFALLGANGWA